MLKRAHFWTLSCLHLSSVLRNLFPLRDQFHSLHALKHKGRCERSRSGWASHVLVLKSIPWTDGSFLSPVSLAWDPCSLCSTPMPPVWIGSSEVQDSMLVPATVFRPLLRSCTTSIQLSPFLRHRSQVMLIALLIFLLPHFVPHLLGLVS